MMLLNFRWAPSLPFQELILSEVLFSRIIYICIKQNLKLLGVYVKLDENIRILYPFCTLLSHQIANYFRTNKMMFR